MKARIQLFAFLAFTFSASLAVAGIVKVPVDQATITTAAVRGYDPTSVDKNAPAVGWYAGALQAGSAAATGPVTAAFTSVGSLIRWPAGGKPERVMQNATAYYRGQFIGIRYTAYATQDGDSWTVKAEYPISDNSGRTQTVDWPPVRYYEQVGGFP